MDQLDFEIELNTITLERANGTEEFRIREAVCVFYETEHGNGVTVRVDETEAMHLNEYTDVKAYDPGVEAYFILVPTNTSPDQIVGNDFQIPCQIDEEKQEELTWLYYNDHLGVDDNQIRFKEKDRDLLRVQWTGKMIDPVAFDNSDCIVRADFWATIRVSSG